MTWHLFVILFILSSCGNYRIGEGKAKVGTAPLVFSCPAGFSLVPSHIINDNEEFCIMKFEARNDGTNKPVSTTAGLPWANIEINDAALACQSLGIKYDLISNQEWMAIARNIEEVSSNWNSNIVGSGSLFTGHNDSLPNSLIGVSLESDLYSDTLNTNPSLQKRALTLSNSQTIWDFAGNASEWVDWNKYSLGVQGYYKNDFCDSSFNEFPGINCTGFDLLLEEYSPYDANTDSSNGVGAFKGASSSISDPVAARGGNKSNGTNAGIFSLSFENDRSDSSTDIGFRCVMRK